MNDKTSTDPIDQFRDSIKPSLYRRSAWFRFAVYYPVAYAILWPLLIFLQIGAGISIKGMSNEDEFFPWSFVFAALFSGIWVWRKPIFGPLIRILQKMDKSAD